MLLRLSKKENILVINKRNTTKLANVVYPDSIWVIINTHHRSSFTLFVGQSGVYVVVQFYTWFKFYFPLFLGMVMYDNEFKTKENKI